MGVFKGAQALGSEIIFRFRFNRIFRGVFVEVFERGERLWVFLDLVENNERTILGNDFARLELNGRDDAWGVVAKFELLVLGWVVI